MSFYPEGDEPPVIAPPVRRDPELSIRRDRAATVEEEKARSLAGLATRLRRAERVAISVAAVWFTALVVVGLILAGAVAHAAAHAIMLGWRLIP